MKNKQRKRIRLGKNLVLSILNQERSAGDDVVDFYEHYIRDMATDPVYGPDGSKTGYYIDNDLAQELRMVLSESLPAVREVLIKRHFTNCPVVVVLTDLTK